MSVDDAIGAAVEKAVAATLDRLLSIHERQTELVERVGTADAVLYDEPTAARLLAISPATLADWRRRGKFKPTVSGSKLIRYSREDLDRLVAMMAAGKHLRHGGGE